MIKAKFEEEFGILNSFEEMVTKFIRVVYKMGINGYNIVSTDISTEENYAEFTLQNEEYLYFSINNNYIKIVANDIEEVTKIYNMIKGDLK